MDESGRQNDCSYRSQIETCGRESEIVDNNSKTKFFGQLKYGDVHGCLFFCIIVSECLIVYFCPPLLYRFIFLQNSFIVPLGR